jgi:prephenate dehydrogenase
MKIAIIGGAGRMGRWLAEFLLKDGREIILADRDRVKLREVGKQLDVATANSNAEAVVRAEYILLSVPIARFESVARQIGPLVRQGQVVIDITSTKVMPVEIMHRYITGGIVLGAHPLFGPGARDITNKNFVLTPINEREEELARKAADYLTAKGARVALMTPREHDDTMSLVLGLSHFIALIAADTLLSSGRLKPMDTVGSSTYRILLTLIESVLSEDPELYTALQMNLPRVADFEKLFLDKTGEWAALVSRKDDQAFARRMKSLKKKLEKVSPDFVKSYENVYRIVEGL